VAGERGTVGDVDETGPTPAPVLITAFNRPDRLARLLESLKPAAPPMMRIAIDGPRHEWDVSGVQETRRVAENVPWDCDLKVWARGTNAGIATAIPGAVSRALTEFERVFVIEDDVTVGPQAYEYMSRALDLWRLDRKVYSISAYNMVPIDHLSRPDEPVRLSRVMSSYAWGTWRDRWEAYDPNMTWFAQQSLVDLTDFFGSRIVALRWRQHYRMVSTGLVDSWAYRWVMSTWGENAFSVVPNRPTIRYLGAMEGTHTWRKRRWSELTVEPIDLSSNAFASPYVDEHAERYFHRVNQRSTLSSVLLGRVERMALRLQRRGMI
jgi:hypothetical protein